MMVFYELEVNKKEALHRVVGWGAIPLEQLVSLRLQVNVCKLYSSLASLSDCFSLL